MHVIVVGRVQPHTRTRLLRRISVPGGGCWSGEVRRVLGRRNGCLEGFKPLLLLLLPMLLLLPILLRCCCSSFRSTKVWTNTCRGRTGVYSQQAAVGPRWAGGGGGSGGLAAGGSACAHQRRKHHSENLSRVSLRLSAQQGQPAQRGEQRVSHQRRRIRRRRRRAGGSGGGGGEGDKAGSHPCPGGRGDAAGAWRAGPYHAGKSRDSDEVEAEVESRAPIGVSSTHLTLRFVRFPLLESHFRSERSENLSKSVCSAECNKSAS